MNHPLGSTRTVIRPRHAVISPDSRVASVLPATLALSLIRLVRGLRHGARRSGSREFAGMTPAQARSD